MLRKFAIAAALAFALSSPALADEAVFLVFHVVDGRLSDRTSEMYVGTAPEPGKQVPENSVVKTVVLGSTPEGRNPNNYLRTSSSVIFSPPEKTEAERPAEDKEQKAAAEEAKTSVADKAADPEVSDEEFLKWLRLQYIDDLQRRKTEYEKLKAVGKQAGDK